ncbi:MAG: hypothetical protein IJU31_02950 [Synergistaceae bacterium]|nr:hypothetical protein [Synergistaceae bacterium]
MKRFIFALLLVVLAVSGAFAEPSGKVMMYSSMQEDQLVAIKKALKQNIPAL